MRRLFLAVKQSGYKLENVTQKTISARSHLVAETIINGGNMFKAEDFVQSKTGGPKMQVLRVEGDTLWCARVDDAARKEIEVKAESVNLYHEEGDFGVC
jgi:uncharacterized protein YodC (DUF2158 family)